MINAIEAEVIDIVSDLYNKLKRVKYSYEHDGDRHPDDEETPQSNTNGEFKDIEDDKFFRQISANEREGNGQDYEAKENNSNSGKEAKGDELEEEKIRENKIKDVASQQQNNPRHKKRRKHYAKLVGLTEINKDAIKVDHDLKLLDYKVTPKDLQNLLVLPANVFLKIYEHYLKMKNKLITDANQYMLEDQEEVNIFTKILEDKKSNDLTSRKK